MSYWTEERIALLRKLVADGFSAGHAAKQLGGGCTRNQALGKAYRLGLVFGLSAASSPDAIRQRAADAPRLGGRPRVGRDSTLQNRINSRAASVAPPKSKPDAPRRLRVVQVESKPRRLIDFRGVHDGLCRWPLDLNIKTPATADSLFCAAPTSGEDSFCPAHGRLSRDSHQGAKSSDLLRMARRYA